MSVASSAVVRPDRVTFQQRAMIRLSGLTPEMKLEICKALTIPNPQYNTMRRFSGFVPSSIKKFLHGYVEAGDDLFVPPGFGWDAWKIVQGLGGEPAFAPDGIVFEPAPLGLTYTGESRPYQDRVLREIVPVRQCTVEMPCGSGKTDVAVRLVCERDARTLVVVHTIDLMMQWVARFEARTGLVPATYGGKVKSKKKTITGAEPVIVATVQSLKRSAGLLETLALTRELVIVDEAHHTPASTFTDVLAHLHPRYRYGFTATKTRADGLTAMIDWWIGPTRAKVERRELEDAGAVMRADLELYPTGFTAEFRLDDTGEYSNTVKALLDDEERRESIPMWIARAQEPGRVHLVIADSIEYGDWLTTCLRGMWRVEADLLNGQMSKKDRAAVLDRVRAGATHVVVATTVADEGLDLPCLTDVWMVTPTRSPAKVEQRVGRILRPAQGKPKPRIHDVVDVGVVAIGRDQRTGGEFKTRTMINQFKNRVHQVYKHVVDRGIDEAFALIREWRGR